MKAREADIEKFTTQEKFLHAKIDMYNSKQFSIQERED